MFLWVFFFGEMVFTVESNDMFTKIGTGFQEDDSYVPTNLLAKYHSDNVSCQDVSVSVYFLIESAW